MTVRFAFRLTPEPGERFAEESAVSLVGQCAAASMGGVQVGPAVVESATVQPDGTIWVLAEAAARGDTTTTIRATEIFMAEVGTPAPAEPADWDGWQDIGYLTEDHGFHRLDLEPTRSPLPERRPRSASMTSEVSLSPETLRILYGPLERPE